MTTTFHAAPSRCDALIVGGRCAGAATAMLLARKGLSVRVVEKRAYGSDALSTHALMRGGVMQLHHWCLLDRLRAAGTPPVPSATFAYGEERITIPTKPVDGIDALAAPRRTVLDALLADAAGEAGARIEFGAALAGLVRSEGGRVEGAVIRRPDGTQERVRAGIVIGADGVASGVARSVMARTIHEGRHATAVLFAYWKGATWGGYEWGYDRGFATGVIPTNDAAACVFVAIPSARFQSLQGTPEESYRHLIATRAPALRERLSGAVMDGKVRAFGGKTGHLRQAFGDGWALVGDAGYFKDPITAHGITDALRDAELLAEAVAAGTPQALAAYQDERDAHSLPFLEATDEIASLDWSFDRLKALHMTVNAAMKGEVEMLRRRHGTLPAPGPEAGAALPA
ncbi:NAD(P)/FAD-dependent oxidoreductase [Acuticoccus sediminis]|uniref:NAD(P)/FAD-dependent oxidoreductase n=1 Tax=Acuticoccus sediminis TaxID=2184697 RepID=UPI001CFCFC17|nr:NAD(P)/FAD-dependent oxidoreductase [Acuticoccus sediminis]